MYSSISGRPIGCQPFSAYALVASALEISPRVPILPIEEEGDWGSEKPDKVNGAHMSNSRSDRLARG